MNRTEKLAMLQKLCEKDLTKDFLIPLYESEGMECKNVRYTHRKLEFGKDVIYYKDDEYGNRVYTGVQVKKTRIKTSDVADIFRQITEAFGEPFTNLCDGKKKDLDQFVVLTSNEILEEAKDSFWASLRGVRLDKLVRCIDGNQLVALFEKHMPSAFWEEYDYFNKYFNAMKAEFEKITDISAIGQKEPVPLENIYVSLKLSEKIKTHGVVCDGFDVEGTIKLKEPEIPVVQGRTIVDEKTEPRKVERQVERDRILDADRAVKEFDKLVIVGSPGSGKTTLLKHLALKSCTENLKVLERTCVPIFITLRNLSESGKDLRQYIDEVFEQYQFPKAKEFVENDLKNGNCQLLLDGFDELATKEQQEKIAVRIHRFMKKYHNCQVIVTSRIAGYHDELSGFTKLELMDFDDEQIKLFIQNWFGKSDPEKATSMQAAIKANEQLKALARNPLMIAIIAIIYEEDRVLPQRRADLYNRCVDVLLSKWDMQKRLKNEYSADKKEFILRKLAFYCHINNKRVMTEKEVMQEMLKYFQQIQLKNEEVKPFLKEIWQRSYLLRQISMDSYDFLHLSFQEYFTASELKEQEEGIFTIIRHLEEPWWGEPILLYVGIGNDATTLIKRIQKEVPEDIFYSNLMLFGKCVADARFTEETLREKIVNDLWSLYKTAEFAPLKEKAIAVLALIKPETIIDSLIKELKDKEGDVQERAAAALGEIGSEKAVEPLITALTTAKESDVRGSAAYVLGGIGSEKAVEPLITALTTDKESDVRERAAAALGGIGSEKAVEPLITALTTDKESDVRERAAYALGEIGSEKAVEPLITALTTAKESDVQGSAAYVLGGIGSEKAVEPLITALTTAKESDVQGSAAYVLGGIGSEKTVETLITALTTDKESDVRERAAAALGGIGSEKAVEPLITALTTDKESDVQERAASALGGIGSEKAVETLITALTTAKESDVRERAASALGEIGSEKAVEPLITALTTDKESDVRERAASALGGIGSEKAVETLITALTTAKESDVRGSAAAALGGIGSEKAVETLITALTTDKESDVRGSAAYALGEIESEKAVEPLITALTTDKESDVRWSAAYALGGIGSEKAVEPLITALTTDKESDVRWSAAYALGGIGSEKAVEPLITALTTDKESDVRARAASALGEIGSEKAVEPLKSALKDEGEWLGDKVKDSAFTALEQISRRIHNRIPFRATVSFT